MNSLVQLSVLDILADVTGLGSLDVGKISLGEGDGYTFASEWAEV